MNTLTLQSPKLIQQKVGTVKMGEAPSPTCAAAVSKLCDMYSVENFNM